jgi:hypothetical protein
VEIINKLWSTRRSSSVAQWGLQLAIAIFVPGGLIALVLVWWLNRRKFPSSTHRLDDSFRRLPSRLQAVGEPNLAHQ